MRGLMEKGCLCTLRAWFRYDRGSSVGDLSAPALVIPSHPIPFFVFVLIFVFVFVLVFFCSRGILIASVRSLLLSSLVALRCVALGQMPAHFEAFTFVLTAGCWPLQSVSSSFKPPAPIEDYVVSFLDYYGEVRCWGSAASCRFSPFWLTQGSVRSSSFPAGQWDQYLVMISFS